MGLPKCPLCMSDFAPFSSHVAETVACTRPGCELAAGDPNNHEATWHRLAEQAAKARAWDAWMDNHGGCCHGDYCDYGSIFGPKEQLCPDERHAGDLRAKQPEDYLFEERKKGGL